jgi:hypothetical protein
LVLDVKVEENKETLDLLSFPIRFICGISYAGVNYSTNLAVKLAGVLYFEFFLKKTIPPIYRNGGSIIFQNRVISNYTWIIHFA